MPLIFGVLSNHSDETTTLHYPPGYYTRIFYISIKMWLQTFVNRIDLSPAFFVIAFIVSLLVAAFTVSFQATKAAIANPVRSLRSE